MRHSVIATSAAGGVWLWGSAMSFGGKHEALLTILFFVFIPLAMAISAIAIGVAIIPVWSLLRRTSFGNPITLAFALAILVLLAFPHLYSHIPSVWSRILACWWAFVWLPGMGVLYAVISRPETKSNEA